jgi:hypothetical protein
VSNLPEKKEESQPVNIQAALLEIVQRKDIDLDKLERYIDLQFKMEERQSKMAFMNAMAGFQGDCPSIPKSKRVNFKSVDYKYSPIEEITKIINPITQKWGLSYAFDIRKTESPNENNLVTIISHESGHSKEFNYFFNPIHNDERMNRSQQAKSSITYAKRAALENALGIVTGGEDNDARGEDTQAIDEMQLNQIKALIEETKTDLGKFLGFMKVESLEAMTSFDAKRAIVALKQKKAKL